MIKTLKIIRHAILFSVTIQIELNWCLDFWPLLLKLSIKLVN